jgi:predicted nucleic acid-binding protein
MSCANRRGRQDKDTQGLLKRHWTRKGRTLSLPDATLAAVAIAYRCVLVTENTKDFLMPEISLYPCDFP